MLLSQAMKLTGAYNMTLCVCSICEELREALLDATQRHMATLMRFDQGMIPPAMGDLERSLEAARRQLDEATSAFAAHQQRHARAAESGSRFNGLSIVERVSPDSKANPVLSVVPRRDSPPLSSDWRHAFRDDSHEDDDSPLPPLAA